MRNSLKFTMFFLKPYQTLNRICVTIGNIKHVIFFTLNSHYKAFALFVFKIHCVNTSTDEISVRFDQELGSRGQVSSLPQT